MKAEPDWDASVEDEETATVVLTVPMVEELVIRQDENGAIPWRGERWSLAEPGNLDGVNCQHFA